MVLKITVILNVLLLYVISGIYHEQIDNMYESDKDKILPILCIFGAVFIITFILYSIIHVKISEKFKDSLVRIINVLATSIITQLFIYIVFPQILGDSFDNNIDEYLTYIVVFFITGILIYTTCLIVRKFKFFSVLLPILNICLALIYINTIYDNFYLGYVLINSILIYLTTLMMMKYRMAFILPVIYLIHAAIFRINYIWAQDMWILDAFYRDGAKLLFCFALSFIPFTIYYIYKNKRSIRIPLNEQEPPKQEKRFW